MDAKPQPIETLRDGRLKSSIWENQGKDGDTYFTVTLAKTYEDRHGKLKDTHSLSGSEALRGASLLEESHKLILGIQRERSLARRADRQADRAQPSQEDRPSRFQDRGAQDSGPNLGR